MTEEVLRMGSFRDIVQRITHTTQTRTWTHMTPDATTSGNLHIIDEVALLKRLNGNATLAKKIALMFLEKAPRYMEELQECLAENNQTGARHRAHNLKGAAATLGADRVAALAGELEELDVITGLDQADQTMQKLTQELECLEKALTERGWLA